MVVSATSADIGPRSISVWSLISGSIDSPDSGRPDPRGSGDGDLDGVSVLPGMAACRAAAVRGTCAPSSAAGPAAAARCSSGLSLDVVLQAFVMDLLFAGDDPGAHHGAA